MQAEVGTGAPVTPKDEWQWQAVPLSILQEGPAPSNLRKSDLRTALKRAKSRTAKRSGEPAPIATSHAPLTSSTGVSAATLISASSPLKTEANTAMKDGFWQPDGSQHMAGQDVQDRSANTPSVTVPAPESRPTL